MSHLEREKMNKQNDLETTDLPVGRAAACQRLEQSGGRKSHSHMRYRLLRVYSLYVEERHYLATVRNPRYRGFWKLLEPEFVQGSTKGLSELYVDGKSEGRLHGGSEGQARSIQLMLASTQKPVNLIIDGHFTSSGWFVDSIKVEQTSND
jgi:hypothetical protein